MNYVIANGVKQSAKRREVAKSNRGDLVCCSGQTPQSPFFIRDCQSLFRAKRRISLETFRTPPMTGKNVLNRIFTLIKKSSGEVNEYY